MKAPANRAASSLTSISMSSWRISNMRADSRARTPASTALAAIAPVECLAGHAHPVRQRERAQTNQHVAFGMARVHVREEQQVRACARQQHEWRGGFPQPLLPGA